MERSCQKAVPPTPPSIKVGTTLFRGGRGDLRRWAAFLFGIFLIFIFVSVIGPWILELPYLKPINTVIQERGIEANLYDYTEVELFGDADFYMRHALEDSQKDSGYIISIILGVALFSIIMWIGYRFLPLDHKK